MPPSFQRGELSAAIELRRLFPGITDNVQALACARTIAGWKPLPTKKQCNRRLPAWMIWDIVGRLQPKLASLTARE